MQQQNIGREKNIEKARDVERAGAKSATEEQKRHSWNKMVSASKNKRKINREQDTARKNKMAKVKVRESKQEMSFERAITPKTAQGPPLQMPRHIYFRQEHSYGTSVFITLKLSPFPYLIISPLHLTNT